MRKFYEIIHVVYRWVLREEKTGRIVKEYLTKEQAVKDLPTHGIIFESNKVKAEVRIKRLDGTIEDSRTYGDDPFPPKG